MHSGALNKALYVYLIVFQTFDHTHKVTIARTFAEPLSL